MNDYCHRENSSGNTIVRRFCHTKERERTRREKVRNRENRISGRERKQEKERERKGMGVRIESEGSVRKEWTRWETTTKKKMESPRGRRGDWHSRLVKLRWSRMESAGYRADGQCRGRSAAIGHGRSI